MKKIFIVIAVLVSCVANSQPGYTTINSRFNWLAGIFRALGLPAGDSAQFTAGQAQRQGSVYFDSVNTPDSPNGYYIYEDPNGGNDPFWNLQATAQQICQNRLLTDWNVSWQGTGFNYSVHGGLSDGTGSYQLGCSFYTADSATVTFATADPDEDRIDIIFLDATGVQVREGDLSAPGTAVRPTVNVDEILLTEVLVAAGATSPTLTQLMVYNENTESVVTNTGTTTDGANTTNTYVGTLSTNVTNITHNDQVFFTKSPPASTWNVLGFDGFSIAILLKAVMPTNANLGVALQVGTTTSGTEVIVPLVKTNIATYQQISIPISAFGNMANTNITRVRFRYIRPASGANYTGFYLDYIYFVDGFNSTPSSPATFTFNPPVGFQVTPSNTQQSPGIWTMGYASGALTGQYYTREGWVTLPEFVDEIGTLNGRSKTADGGEIDGDEFFFQTVDATFPGLMTSAMFTKLDSNYYITNSGAYDTLAWPQAVNITAIKSIKDSTGIGIVAYQDYIAIYATGGAGGFFTPSTATANTSQDADGFDFELIGVQTLTLTGEDFAFAFTPGAGITHSIQMDGTGNWVLSSDDAGETSSIGIHPSGLLFTSESNLFTFTDLVDDLTATKVVVYNTSNKAIGTVDLSTLVFNKNKMSEYASNMQTVVNECKCRKCRKSHKRNAKYL